MALEFGLESVTSTLLRVQLLATRRGRVARTFEGARVVPRALQLACIGSAALFVGCPVDDRHLQAVAGSGAQAGSTTELHPAAGGMGGSGGNGGSEIDAAVAGQSDTANHGGVAGEGGQLPQLVDGCADLDGDGVSDCTQTRAMNSTFASDVAGWIAEAKTGDSFTTTLRWNPYNAWGGDPSGSAEVTVAGAIDFNGLLLRAAVQCLPLGPEQLVIVYANALVESGQDPAGSAEIDISFFDSPDCTGSATVSFPTPAPTEAPADSWLTLHAGSLSPATTKSALVKLGVVKPFRAETLTARFDNILVKVQSP